MAVFGGRQRFETIVDDDEVLPGQTVRGRVIVRHAPPGAVLRDLDVYTTVYGRTGPSQPAPGMGDGGAAPAGSAHVVQNERGEQHPWLSQRLRAEVAVDADGGLEVPFELTLPWESPITHVAGHQLRIKDWWPRLLAQAIWEDGRHETKSVRLKVPGLPVHDRVWAALADVGKGQPEAITVWGALTSPTVPLRTRLETTVGAPKADDDDGEAVALDPSPWDGNLRVEIEAAGPDRAVTLVRLLAKSGKRRFLLAEQRHDVEPLADADTADTWLTDVVPELNRQADDRRAAIAEHVPNRSSWLSLDGIANVIDAVGSDWDV